MQEKKLQLLLKTDIYLHLVLSNKTISGFSTGNKFNEDYQVGDVIRLTDDNNPFTSSSDTEDHIIASINGATSITTQDSISEREVD